MTEVGILLGIREYWPKRHGGIPIEQIGAALADGNGNQACSMVLTLAKLGYATALYRDSDEALTADQIRALCDARVPVFEYGGSLNTEQAIFSAASDLRVQELLDFARIERGNGAVDDNLCAQLSDLDRATIQEEFCLWWLTSEKDAAELREAIAKVAAGRPKGKGKKAWFKDQRIARALAPIVWNITLEDPSSKLATALRAAEDWLYG
jgi:hypothetical protein